MKNGLIDGRFRMDGVCKLQSVYGHRALIFFPRIFNRSDILYNVLTWENIEKCVLFLNHFISGFEWCAGLWICNKESSNTSNTLSRSECEEEKNHWKHLSMLFRHHPPASFVWLRWGTTNWPNYYQFFTRQSYTPNIHLLLVNSINLLFCYRCCVCYVIIIYFVNEHDIFFCFFFFFKMCMRCWVSSLGLIFFHRVSHPFEFFCVFFGLHFFVM